MIALACGPSWPSTVGFVAFLVFAGFFLWLGLRGLR